MKNRIKKYTDITPSRRLSMNLKERKELNEWSYEWNSRLDSHEDAEWWDMGPPAEWDPSVPPAQFTNTYWPNESGADDFIFYEPHMNLRVAIVRYNFQLYRRWVLQHLQSGPTYVVVRNDFFEEASHELKDCWVMGHNPRSGRMIEITDPQVGMALERRVCSELIAKCGKNTGGAA